MKSKLVLFMYSMEGRYQSLRQRLQSLGQCRLVTDKRGFGMNELLGVAAAVILAAFIVIPGLRSFANIVMVSLSDWWNNTIDTKIFPST